MDMNDKIKRINELYHKSQVQELSEEEKAEQKQLRMDYVAAVRGSLKAQLDNIDIKEEDGTIINLGEQKKLREQQKTEDISSKKKD